MALKLVQLVQELGEERLPEPAPAASSSASAPQAASHSEREPQIWTASQESTESPIESHQEKVKLVIVCRLALLPYVAWIAHRSQFKLSL
jgi:hypothetical protein